MRIIDKFKVGDTVGYTLEETSGLSYPVTERGLYDEDVLIGLTEAGYKVMDYHGNILMPDGVSIKDLVEVQCTATEDEIQTMLDMEDLVLTEAEATKYFCRDIEITAIELRKPNVEIKTREELVKYLEKVKRQRRLTNTDVDVRPLNAFVAPEALFTLDEYMRDSSVKEYMQIVESRRKLQSVGDFKRLVEFLQNEGLLGETFKAADVKEAYLAWGICGIKTPILDKRVEYGVVASLYDVSETAAAMQKNAGCIVETCLLGKDGTLYTTSGNVNLRECNDFEIEPIKPVKENTYWDLYRKASTWDTEYVPIDCFVPKPAIRTYMRLMDDNGVTYRAKIDTGKMVIMDLRSTIMAQDYLSIKCVDNTYIPIDFAISNFKYQQFMLARIKARDIVKARTITPPVMDSYNLYVNEGVTPESAVNYVAKVLKTDGSPNMDISNEINYTDATDMYRVGPDKSLIKRYNPDGIETSNIDELIDVMLSTREDMIQEGTYLNVSKDDKSAYAQQTRDEIALRPLEKLEFVKMAKEGKVAVGRLGMGIVEDGTVSIDNIAKFLILACERYNNGEINSIERFTDILSRIESEGIFDIKELVKERNAAFRGYLRDRAKLNAERASQCAVATYVTKIFREASNTSVAEQRHYMFECISLDLFNKKTSKAVQVQNAIAEAIREAVDRTSLTLFNKEILKIEAPSTAIKIMFKLILKKATVQGGNGFCEISEVLPLADADITLNIKLRDEVYAAAMNPTMFSVGKLCTLCDWCEMEMTRQAWNLYCLNANITPWEVKPKDGVTIPVYSFAVNYIFNKALEQMPEGFRNRVAQEKAKVNEFATTFLQNSLIQNDLDENLMVYDEATIDGVLSPTTTETADNYYQRFAMHNKSAAARGEYLQKMRLRSDVVYENWAKGIAPYTIDEDVYAPLNGDNTLKNKWLTETMPAVVSAKDAGRVGLTGNSIEIFDIKKRSLQEARAWSSYILGEYKPYTVNIFLGTRIMCVSPKGKKIFEIQNITKEFAVQMAEKGICYQLNAREFLFKTTTGVYCLEIK